MSNYLQGSYIIWKTGNCLEILKNSEKSGKSQESRANTGNDSGFSRLDFLSKKICSGYSKGLNTWSVSARAEISARLGGLKL